MGCKNGIIKWIFLFLFKVFLPHRGTFCLVVFAGSMVKIHPQNASCVGVGLVPWQHVKDAPIKLWFESMNKIQMNHERVR